MSEWQPIEMAPKDGTRILGTGLDYGVGPGRYFVDIEFRGVSWWHGYQAPLGESFICNHVTHWMPLPKPPVTP